MSGQLCSRNLGGAYYRLIAGGGLLGCEQCIEAKGGEEPWKKGVEDFGGDIGR